MNKKRVGAPDIVGASSLLVIFAVLCLTVFALLSLSTAGAGRNLSDSSVAAVEGYYKADSMAEKLLSRLRLGECPEGVLEEDGIYSYACVISDTQALVVEVAVEGEAYTVLRWQAVSTTEWQADDTLRVWDGEI